MSDAVSRKQQEGSQARRTGGPGMHLVQVPKCLSFSFILCGQERAWGGSITSGQWKAQLEGTDQCGQG